MIEFEDFARNLSIESVSRLIVGGHHGIKLNKPSVAKSSAASADSSA
jgi:hypothetical protein